MTGPVDWDGEFGITRIDEMTFKVWLCLNMQHDLNQYVEPVLERPDTHENEHREYFIDDIELHAWIVGAQLKADEYRQSAGFVLALQHRGISYADVHRLNTGEEPDQQFSRNPYEADEDLMFIYERLAALHRFIFEAKEAIDNADQREAGTVEFDSPGEPPF